MGEVDAEGNAEVGVARREGGAADKRMVDVPIEEGTQGKHTAKRIIGTQLERLGNIAVRSLREVILNLADQHTAAVIGIVGAKRHTATGSEQLLVVIAGSGFAVGPRARGAVTLFYAEQLSGIVHFVAQRGGQFVGVILHQLNGGQVKGYGSAPVPSRRSGYSVCERYFNAYKRIEPFLERNRGNIVRHGGDQLLCAGRIRNGRGNALHKSQLIALAEGFPAEERAIAAHRIGGGIVMAQGEITEHFVEAGNKVQTGVVNGPVGQ